MYKQREDGKYEVVTRESPRCGEVVADIGYAGNEEEWFTITVTTRRLITCRLTYALPHTGSALELLIREKLAKASGLMEAARVRAKELDRQASLEEEGLPHKFSVTTGTLSFLYREAYTRGIEEIAVGLSHNMDEEWRDRQCEWVHWSGHRTSTRDEYEYVMGPATKDHTYPGRDINNDGTTLDDFVQMTRSWLQRRHQINDAQRGGAPAAANARRRKSVVGGSSSSSLGNGDKAEGSPSEGKSKRRSASEKSKRRSTMTLLVEGAEKYLTKEEVIAVRLYTGPGYAPINGWLREVANLPAEPKDGITRWGAWSEERSHMDADKARRHAAMDRQSSFGATVGHLVTAVRKIAAANTTAENERTLYRGLEGSLPGRFWLPDDLGIVCVTDTAFMSTSLDESTSIHYLSMPHAGKVRGIGLLWELHAGQEDDTAFHCGADVSILSQFGNEQEVLFPPLTMLRCIPRDKDDPKYPPPHDVPLPMQRHNLDRAHYLSTVPGEKTRQERILRLWQSVADMLIHARSVTNHTRAVHIVSEEHSKGGHPFVRVSVQPCFTGIDAGEGKEEDDELDELSKLEKTLSKDDNE